MGLRFASHQDALWVAINFVLKVSVPSGRFMLVRVQLIKYFAKLAP